MKKYLLLLLATAAFAAEKPLRFDEATGAVTNPAVINFTTTTLQVNGSPVGTGSGDVVGPGSSTNDNVAFFDGTTGKLLKDSGVTLSGSNTGDEAAASDSVVGVVELATQGEVDTGTDTGRVVTPATLANSVHANQTHTGEVTGSTSLTIDSTAISNKTLVTGVSGDMVLITDASDGGNLKRVNLSDLLVGSGDMLKSVYDIGDSGIVDSSEDLESSAITGKTTVTPVAGDFLLFSDTSDSGNLKKVDATDLLGGGGGTSFTVITGVTEYYVDPLGTDDPGNGTSSGAGAWLTIQYALDQLATTTIISGDSGTVLRLNVADGTYTETGITFKSPFGAHISNFQVRGNVGTPSNVVIDSSGSIRLTGSARILGVKFDLATDGGIKCDGRYYLQTVEVDGGTTALTTSPLIQVTNGGELTANPITITADRTNSDGWSVTSGSTLQVGNLTYSGTVDFDNTVIAQSGAVIMGVTGATSSGSHTGNNLWQDGAIIINGAAISTNAWSKDTNTDADSFGVPSVFESGVTADRPANPVVGQRYFDTDLNEPVWYNGTTWQEASGLGGGGGGAGGSSGAWVPISTQTVSSPVASVDFTSGIDSTYDNYIVVFEGAKQTASASLQIRVSISSSFQSGANYSTYQNTYNTGNDTRSVTRSQTATSIGLSGTSGTSGVSSGRITLYDVNSTTEKKMIEAFQVVDDDPLASAAYKQDASGYWNGGNGAVDGVQIFPNSGNIDGGTFTLYGLRKTAPAPTGWVKIEAQTVTVPVSTVDFTTGIDDTYDTYKMVFSGLELQSNDSSVNFRVGAGSFDSGNNYDNLVHRRYGAAQGFVEFNAQTNFQGITGFANGANDSVSGELIIYNARNTSVYKDAKWTEGGADTVSGVGFVDGRGQWLSTSAIDRIQLVVNIDAGTVTLYGLAK